MTSVRVVCEMHRDGDWELRTSDLPDLIEVLGEDLVAAFCSCFVHADRIVSLVAFFHLSTRRFRKGSIAERRNFLTFAAFLVGTLKEVSENLKQLKRALHNHGLLDKERWQAGLGRWQDWGATGAVATARKKLSFHVDSALVLRGLQDISASSRRRTILHGSTGRLRDSAFLLGQDASLRGLETSVGNLNVLGDPAKYLELTDALEREFLCILDKSGLKPILVRSSGRRVASGA